MKKILLITLLLIPFFGFAQTTKPVEGFLGIKFGSSKLAVITAIKAKGGIIDKAHTTATQVAFSNVKLGSRDAVGLAVNFINDKAFIAIFLFKADLDPHTIDYYNELVSDVNGIYGPGTPTKTFTSGFSDGDGNEVTAIEGGFADYHTEWDSNTNNTAILATINSGLFVILTYQDNKLRDEADAAKKSKESSDY